MFVMILLALCLLERMGIAPAATLVGVIGAAFAMFFCAALLSHSRRAIDFYVADRKIGPVFGGVTVAASFAGLMSAGFLGGTYGSYAAFLVAGLSIAGGHLLLAVAIVPGLAGIGAYTTGDFLAARFNGRWVRLAWAGVAFAVSYMLLLAALKATGPILVATLHITPRNAVYLASVAMLAAALPGGMRSFSWTQAIQYFVIALASVIPAGFLAVAAMHDMSGTQDIARLVATSVPTQQALVEQQGLISSLLLVAGVASLPQLLAKTLAAPSRMDASASMVWASIFAALVIAMALLGSDLLAGTGSYPSDKADAVPALAAILAALPAALAGLLVAGILAALFAFGQAALFAASSTLSHDVYDEILDRKGPEGRRIFIARLMLILAAASAAALAQQMEIETPALIQWALALAAAAVFAPVVIGVWWRRTSHLGAIGGMIVGCGVVAVPAAFPVAAIGPTESAGIGLIAAACTTIALSLVPGLSAVKVPSTVAGAGDQSQQRIHERPA
jgi:cation/acetate symporter